MTFHDMCSMYTVYINISFSFHLCLGLIYEMADGMEFFRGMQKEICLCDVSEIAYILQDSVAGRQYN